MLKYIVDFTYLNFFLFEECRYALTKGTEEFDTIEELYPMAGEDVIDKPGKGSFYQTEVISLYVCLCVCVFVCLCVCVFVCVCVCVFGCVKSLLVSKILC